MTTERDQGLNSAQERPDSPEIDSGRIQYGRRDNDWLQEGPYAGRGPRGYQRSDERICEDICEGLTWHGAIDAGEVEVSVRDREVTLAGSVESREAYKLAENIARSVSGVREVRNRLGVRAG